MNHTGKVDMNAGGRRKKRVFADEGREGEGKGGGQSFFGESSHTGNGREF